MRLLSLSLAAALAAGAAVPALAQHQVREGAPWSEQGMIEAAGPRDGEERLYRDYPLRLQAGQRLRISAVSEDFDNMLQLFRQGESEPVAMDDDGGEGLNALLSYTPQTAGDYILRVLSYSNEGTGRFVVGVEALPPLPPPLAFSGEEEVTRWTVARAALSTGNPDHQGNHFADYLVEMAAGSEVLLSLDSEDFDPVLQIFRPETRDGEPLAIDDDGGAGYNALLVFAPEETGPYVVRVTTFEAGKTGAYRLRIAR